MMTDHVAPVVGTGAAFVIVASCFVPWIRIDVGRVSNAAIDASGIPVDLELPQTLTNAALGGVNAHSLAGFGTLVSFLAVLVVGCSAASSRHPRPFLAVASLFAATVVTAMISLIAASVLAIQQVVGWALPDSWQPHSPSMRTAPGLWIALVASFLLLASVVYQTWTSRSQFQPRPAPRAAVVAGGRIGGADADQIARDVWG